MGLRKVLVSLEIVFFFKRYKITFDFFVTISIYLIVLF